MRGLRWALKVLSLELRKLFSYRVDFWVNFAGSLVVELLVAYCLWRAVYGYRGVTQIGGYGFEAIVYYALLVPLVNRIVRSNEGAIWPEIYDGSLTRYLVYPVSYFSFKAVGQLAQSMVCILQLLAGLALFALWRGVPPDVHLSVAGVLTGILLSIGAAFLYYTMTFAVELVAFWAESVWSLLVMLRFSIGLLGGGLMPITFFPEWTRPWLRALPFIHMTSTPVRAFMGQVSPAEALSSLAAVAAWSAVFAGVGYLVWRRGTLQYTGVGI